MTEIAARARALEEYLYELRAYARHRPHCVIYKTAGRGCSCGLLELDEDLDDFFGIAEA